MATLTRRKFTTDEYHRMAQVGLLTEGDRVELIAGDIVQLPPIGDRHAGTVDLLTELFSQALSPGRAQVRVQNPIRLGSHSEPQPDLALLHRRRDFYRSAHPGPRDVVLVVEVAESSAAQDREVKAPEYAVAGIRELWIVDLSTGSIERHRDPSRGAYRSVETLGPGDRIAPEAFPEIELDVSSILE